MSKYVEKEASLKQEDWDSDKYCLLMLQYFNIWTQQIFTVQYMVHKQMGVKNLSKYIENGIITTNDSDHSWYDLLKKDMNNMDLDPQQSKLLFYDVSTNSPQQYDENGHCYHQYTAFQLNPKHVSFKNIVSNKLQKMQKFFKEKKYEIYF